MKAAEALVALACALRSYAVFALDPAGHPDPGPLWPKTQTCMFSKVLHDVTGALNWPGVCMGVTQSTADLGTDKTKYAFMCAQQCQQEAGCNVWQLTMDDICNLGLESDVVTDCWGHDGDPNYKVKAGQRLQHGATQVLAQTPTTAKQLPVMPGFVSGLYNIGTMKSTSKVYGIHRCRSRCYSDVNCRYWYYGKHGCWVEHATAQVPTVDGKATPAWDITSDYFKQMDAGEIVKHECKPPKVFPVPRPSYSFMMIGFATFGIVTLLCGCGFAWYCCLHPLPAKKEKKYKKKKKDKKKKKKKEKKEKKEKKAKTRDVHLLPHARAQPLMAQPTYAAAPQYQMVPTTSFAQAPSSSFQMQPTYAAQPMVMQSMV